MTEYRYRTDLGLPAKVYKIDGKSLRRKLPLNLNTVVIHYTGVDGKYANSDLGKMARTIHSYKPNEYNYIIHANGTVGEFAGQYEAIHCLNYNDTTYGVLMLNGTKEPLTDAQIESFNWLMNLLKWTKQITPDARVVPHKQLRATACPGQLILNRWSELVGMT